MAKRDLKTNDRYYWSYCWCIVRTWICPASQLGTLETLYAKRLTTKPFASDSHSHKLRGYGLDSADLLVINHAVPKPSVMWMHRRTAMTQWKPASNGNENKDAAQVVTSKPKHHHKTETMALGWCMRWGTCGFQMQIAKNTRAEFFSFPSPGLLSLRCSIGLCQFVGNRCPHPTVAILFVPPPVGQVEPGQSATHKMQWQHQTIKAANGDGQRSFGNFPLWISSSGDLERRLCSWERFKCN